MNLSASRLVPALASLALLAATLPAHATSYSGNGATGFGGPIGSGTLTVTNSGANNSSGLISFVLHAGATIGNDDDVVIYIDSVTGGFSNTSTFADESDGGHIAISGADASNAGDSGASTRDLETFATGFNADYALVLDPTDSFAGLFQLGSGGNGTIPFVTGANYSNPSTNVYDFSLTASQLGLTGTTGSSFAFVATLISQTAYRSNETIGSSTTTPDSNDSNAPPNGGFNGSQTFTSSDSFSFVAVPEASTVGMLACGCGVLLFWSRRCFVR